MDTYFCGPVVRLLQKDTERLSNFSKVKKWDIDLFAALDFRNLVNTEHFVFKGTF